MTRLLKKLIPFLMVAVIFTVKPVYAEFLNGVLSEDKTLSPAGNNYYVTANYIIPEGITLTILPGTRIYFYSGKSIIVDGGVLKAEGTDSNPVVFDQYDPLGTNESTWESIRLINSHSVIDSLGQYVSGTHLKHLRILRADSSLILTGNSTIRLENVYIQNGRNKGKGITIRSKSELWAFNSTVKGCNYGIILSDSSALKAKNITIENGDNNYVGYGIYLQSGSYMDITESTIQLCEHGISIYNSNGNIIKGCQITNCLMGIYFNYGIQSRYNLIENNNISYHENVGIFISMGNSGVQYNRLSNNTINYNMIGLHLGNGGVNDHGFNNISGNSVQYNTEIGIKLSQDADTLYNNLISHNKRGLELYRAAGNHIRNNFINNGELGVMLSQLSDSNMFECNNIFDNLISCKITVVEDSSASVYNTFRYNSITGSASETFIIETGPQESIQYNTILSLSDTSTFKNLNPFDLPAINNYWGAIDTTVLNSMIVDKYDNSKYGEVLYRPFDETPDPAVPISRPRLVVKKLVNNVVTLSWLENPETDLAGYKIYYGTPQTVIQTGLETMAIIPGVEILSVLKVTAIDMDADGTNDQFEGHESGFSYAIAGPWAGNNNSVCSGDNFFTEEATAFEYQTLLWETAGDGSFFDASALHTFYMPGFNDKAAGEINLILKMVTLSGLTLTDTVNVKILDYLVIDAGADTTIMEGSSLDILNVKALNYLELLWTTSGDGIFTKPDTLFTTYIPGDLDKSRGWANLTMTITSNCGSISDNFMLTIIPGYDITGSVTKNYEAVSGAVILAFNTNNESTRAISSTTSSSSGKFVLNDLTGGDYYVYAVPDPQSSQTHIPTYYASRFTWLDSHLMLMETDVYDVDIELQPIDMQLPAGDGSISGIFTYDGIPPADFNIYNKYWFESSTGSPIVLNGEDNLPAGNHIVLLMNPAMTKIVGWTLSNLDGLFVLSGLPYGAYRLWGEKAGYENRISDVIYITPDVKDITGVELVVDLNNKRIEAFTPEVVLSEGLIYPNPTMGYFNISAKDLGTETNIEIEIINEKGMSVITLPLTRSSSSGFGPVHTTGLSRGLYMCIIRTPSGIQKLTKITVN
jgi:parallel beta-helix repeat protein